MTKVYIKFEKFKKALSSLEAIYLNPIKEDGVNMDATIQRFEFTFELTWKFLKDYFLQQGIPLNYPKEVIQEAFASGIIRSQDQWVEMLADRNMTSYTYDQKLATEIYMRIRHYVPCLKELLTTMEKSLPQS